MISTSKCKDIFLLMDNDLDGHRFFADRQCVATIKLTTTNKRKGLTELVWPRLTNDNVIVMIALSFLIVLINLIMLWRFTSRYSFSCSNSFTCIL
jgi:hypothetical protein